MLNGQWKSFVLTLSELLNTEECFYQQKVELQSVTEQLSKGMNDAPPPTGAKV